MGRPASVLIFLLAMQLSGCTFDYTSKTEEPAAPVVVKPDAPWMARVSPQARKNLGLVVRPVALGSFRQAIEVPGVVVDRPGVSDRGVIAPVTGVVTDILAYPGQTVLPDQPLFTMRLVSERLHSSQLELFKATKEIELARRQRERLQELSKTGIVPQARIIEIDNRMELLDVNVQAYRQDLLARGVPAAQVDAAARGEFITEVTVKAPPPVTVAKVNADDPKKEAPPAAVKPDASSRYEMQELRVALGQQVEGGTVLCELADHRQLLIEGHAFKSDLALLQEAVRKNSLIEAELENSAGGLWIEPLPPLRIQHLANIVDPDTRVIRFTIRLTNQWHAGREQMKDEILWRFRPGDRLRLRIPAEQREGVFVLPREAVIREGGEAYVFEQNGDLFERLPVQIVEESRSQLAIANDGSIRTGAYIAQNGAASLHRIGKAQAASGMPANVHVHADGTVHAAH